MSPTLLAAVLGLIRVCQDEEAHSLDLHRESVTPFKYGLKSGTRISDNNNANARIIDGSIADMNEYPWMVALKFKNGSRFFCGGSIISDQFILTAAHCVEDSNAEEITVSLGDHDLSTESETKSQNYQIEEIIVHEEYFSHSNGFLVTQRQNLRSEFLEVLYNDIALLKVNGNIKFNETVGPICLSKSDENHIGKIATVTGWGRTENGNPSNILKKAQVRVKNVSECRRKIFECDLLSLESVEFVYPSLCTDNLDGNTYFGDSGGPLFIKNMNNTWEQIGITSDGHLMFPQPTFFTRVSNFSNWIESKIGQSFQSDC